MMKFSVPPNAPVVLLPLVAAYVEATNSFDLERLLATFAADALVNDQLRDYWGKLAIREWAKRDIIGERLTMNVTKVINHYGNSIVTADVNGNYAAQSRAGAPFVHQATASQAPSYAQKTRQPAVSQLMHPTTATHLTDQGSSSPEIELRIATKVVIPRR
jgi:hypothetical protein